MRGDFVPHYVHVVRLKRYFHLNTLRDYDASQLNMLHPQRRVRAADVFRKRGGKIVEAVTYRPGEGRFVVEGDMELLNLYRPPVLQASDGHPGPWLDLVLHVIPDESARHHVIDFFAHLVQRPGVKVNHAVLLGGGQGIGKDSMLKPVISALGAHNVGVVTPLELESAFNDFILNKALVVVQELAAFSKRDLANRLKPLLAEPPHVLHINRKFLPAFDVPNIVNVVMMTNSRTALAIEEDDRRFFVYHSPAERLPATRYRAYHTWLDAHSGDVLGYLLARDVSAFNPKAQPPMTAAKRALIEDSRPLLRQHLEAVIDSMPDLVTPQAVIEMLPPMLRATAPRQIGTELRTLGAAELRKVRMPNGKRPRVWALRRAAMYRSMSDSALAEHYTSMRTTVSLLPGRDVDLQVGEAQ
jgi:hypothetical protein